MPEEWKMKWREAFNELKEKFVKRPGPYHEYSMSIQATSPSMGLSAEYHTAPKKITGRTTRSLLVSASMS